MTRMFKIELYVIPHNVMEECVDSPEGMISQIENDDLRDDCLLKFGKVEMVDIGEWDDDIKFNQNSCPVEEFRKEFTGVRE